MGASQATYPTHSPLPLMTTQERINQLAGAALRSAPRPAGTPQPETFMPSFDRLKTAEFASGPEAAAAAAIKTALSSPVVPMPVPTSALAQALAKAAAQEQHKSDADLKDILDVREGKRAKREKRKSRAMSFALLAIFAAGGSWLTLSPTARAKMSTLMTAVKQSGKDVKSLGSIMGTYEKQLDKVAVQGARIDAAALALGVDPTSDTSAQNASISAGMKDLTGEGGGPTVTERDSALQKKFGVVNKLAKNMAPKTQKATSDVNF